MKKTSLSLAVAILLSPLLASAAGLADDWKTYTSAKDTATIESLTTTVDEANKRLSTKAFDAESTDYLQQLKTLTAEANLPIDEKTLLGNWRCRSTQPDNEFIVRYPFFKCTIRRTEKGLFLEKTSGSQRISGYLFKNKNDEYVFLGGASVNDDPQVEYSGFTKSKQQEHDTIGLVFRKKSGLVIYTPAFDPTLYDMLEFKK